MSPSEYLVQTLYPTGYMPDTHYRGSDLDEACRIAAIADRDLRIALASENDCKCEDCESADFNDACDFMKQDAPYVEITDTVAEAESGALEIVDFDSLIIDGAIISDASGTRYMVELVTGYAHYASALVNNDRSGLDEADESDLADWFNYISTGRVAVEVVDVQGEAFFGTPCSGGLPGDVVEYVIHSRL